MWFLKFIETWNKWAHLLRAKQNFSTRLSPKSLLPNDGPVHSQLFRPHRWPLCKLHEVLHMFSMALTACPERGRHTNKLTEKSLERILGRLFNKPQVPLSTLCPVLYNLFHLSFTFLSFSLNPRLSLPPPSVRSYRRAELEERWVRLEKSR